MDTAEYSLFPLQGLWDAAAAHAALSECLHTANDLIGNYIWHREAFKLSVKHSAELNSHYLCGRTYYGENVEDEWFITYILFKISSNNTNIVCKILDSDGDILLIEAAAAIPSWLNPDTSSQRVFILNGDLHIIPLPMSPADIGIFPVGELSLSAALGLLGPRTRATDDVQKLIRNRVEQFPQRAYALLHNARCFLPVAAAKILQAEPQLISFAVAAFYERDPISMRVCSTMEHFPPQTRVAAPVKFTRCLYAQLVSQRFLPGKIFGALPPATSGEAPAWDTGVKLACGFEMLLSLSRPDSSGVLSEADLPHSTRWKSYLQRLTAAGCAS